MWTKKLRDILLPARAAHSSSSRKTQPLADWFRVRFDDSAIGLYVNPPQRASWDAQIEWQRIIRVCFNAGDLYEQDEIYIFTNERPESYLIPMEADGAGELWNEIIRRKLFDAEVAIEAASSTNKLFCCPAVE
jgi:hypothetical protein